MTASPSTKSVATTGNIRVWFVPSTGAPLSVAGLTSGGTAKDITSSLVAGGFSPAISENSIADNRLGVRQILNARGNFSEQLSLEYIHGDSGDVAQPALTEGTQGFLVYRPAKDNATDPTVGDKVNVYTVELGKQQFQPPAENALFTIKQEAYIKAPTQYLAALTA